MSAKKQVSRITRQTLSQPTENPARRYRCIRCEKDYGEPSDYFFRNVASPLTYNNDGYLRMCKECCTNLYEDLYKAYNDEKLACIMICHYLDYPFYHSIFDSICRGNTRFSLGLYVRRMNNTQNRSKTFQQTLASGELLKTDKDVREGAEVKWSASDLKNKRYVINSIGYDCFSDESYSSADRKFLFNTLSGYLVDDVLDDPHRTQSAIRMVKTILQSSKIDNLINNELASNEPSSNLKSYTESKDKLDRNINQVANDNGFTIKNGGKSLQSSSTLTNIMKEMLDNNFEDIKVNTFDIKMSKAFQHISDISNKSILDQLNFQSDDYARMVSAQREMIEKYERDLQEEQEKNRLLMVENEQLKEQVEDGDPS